MTRVRAHAKINLALLVGDLRPDGLHEVATVLQRIELADEIEIEPDPRLSVEGFAGDTLVRDALSRLAEAAGVEPHWRARIEKRVPVAAGLGGGSSDAAAALRAANESLPEPLETERLREVGASLGADVPFFLADGPQLAEGAGERLTALDLPLDYWVVIALPTETTKSSTGDVYRCFDELGGSAGFAGRRARLVETLAAARTQRDLAAAAEPSSLIERLRAAGAFRTDVTGAGPAVYGLFEQRSAADEAAASIRAGARVWVAEPVW